jgi:hypothetical protein
METTVAIVDGRRRSTTVCEKCMLTIVVDQVNMVVKSC